MEENYRVSALEEALRGRRASRAATEVVDKPNCGSLEWRGGAAGGDECDRSRRPARRMRGRPPWEGRGVVESVRVAVMAHEPRGIALDRVHARNGRCGREEGVRGGLGVESRGHARDASASLLSGDCPAGECETTVQFTFFSGC